VKPDWTYATKMMTVGNPTGHRSKDRHPLLGTKQFLTALNEFDASNIPEKSLTEALQIMAEPFFTFDFMYKQSAGAAYLTSWVISVVTYNRIYMQIAALSEK
jgi:hypothetical protein